MFSLNKGQCLIIMSEASDVTSCCLREDLLHVLKEAQGDSLAINIFLYTLLFSVVNRSSNPSQGSECYQIELKMLSFTK